MGRLLARLVYAYLRRPRPSFASRLRSRLIALRLATRRFSLSEIKCRFFLASDKMRDLCTFLRKRRSKLACDSPGFKTTLAIHLSPPLTVFLTNFSKIQSYPQVHLTKHPKSSLTARTVLNNDIPHMNKKDLVSRYPPLNRFRRESDPQKGLFGFEKPQATRFSRFAWYRPIPFESGQCPVHPP